LLNDHIGLIDKYRRQDFLICNVVNICYCVCQVFAYSCIEDSWRFTKTIQLHCPSFSIPSLTKPLSWLWSGWNTMVHQQYSNGNTHHQRGMGQ